MQICRRAAGCVAWEEVLGDQIVNRLLPKPRGIEPPAERALEQVRALARDRFVPA